MKNSASKILIILLFALLFITVGLFLSTKANPLRREASPPGKTQGKPAISPTVSPTIVREKAKVLRVIDGDTIVLTTGEHLRYLGINTPEINSPNGQAECFGNQATAANKTLVDNQEIELEKDVTNADKYGRLLRYVYADGVSVNEFLLTQGFAELEQIPPDTKYFSQFKEAENEAKKEKRGLWGICDKLETRNSNKTLKLKI